MRSRVSRIIDLTITLAPGIGHPMFRPFHVAPFHVHEIHRRSNADLYMAIHTATHIDAPYHFVVDGIPIDQVPLERLVGEGIMLRVEALAEPRHRLTVAEIQTAAKVPQAQLRGKIAVVSRGRPLAGHRRGEGRGARLCHRRPGTRPRR